MDLGKDKLDREKGKGTEGQLGGKTGGRPGNRRMTGGCYEALAAGYLEGQGLEILERNFRTRTGEIDLIARDGRYLVFVEVKYRRDGAKGDPAEAVDLRKQGRIRGAARYYLYSHGYGEDSPCRFDVVGIMGDQVRWLRDAF